MTEPTDKQKQEARELVRDLYNIVCRECWEPFCGHYQQQAEAEIASALSSRDVEVREVLEGLRYRHGCWCDLPPNITSPDHTCECDAARGLWERVQAG